MDEKSKALDKATAEDGFEMMNNESLHLENGQLQYIARISHGKDSLKMLDVIVSRGLRLDRITTTDVWATDTIRGEHPEMVKFKDRADEYIWRKYHIEVEHLCAMKNGKKVTYEKLFYHIPKRREKDGRYCQQQGTILGFLTKWGPWCQPALKKCVETRIQGFPAQIGSWCKKLKIDYIRHPCFLRAPPRGAVNISWNISASRRMNPSVSAS